LFLGEPHARAAAVLVDELYAAGFKASPHHLERCATRLMRTCLELAHGYDADTRLFGEFLLAPIKEAASGSALRWRDHAVGSHRRPNSSIPLGND
jgi:hypothetical protein